MARNTTRTHLADLLTSRRGAWISLSIGLLVMIALFGAFGGAQAPARNVQAPVTSESARAAELLGEFPGAEQESVLIVASRTDGGELTAADTEALRALAPILLDATDATGPNGTASATEQPERAPEPMLSEDGEAAVFVAPIEVGDSNTQTAGAIEALRAQLAEHTPTGLQLQVTGGPAFGADIAASFEGADFTLLLVTILIVAALLIVTYRSPVLWLIPLAVVALADGLAGRMTAAAASLASCSYVAAP